MNITYVTHTRFPVERAHGKQIAHVCSAMATLGHDVQLIKPSMTCSVTEDPYAYYGVPNNFQIQQIPHFNTSRAWWIPGCLNFVTTMHLYREALRAYLRTTTSDLYYCRSQEVIDPLIETGVPVILELHTLPRRRIARFVKRCNVCACVGCLTTPMRDALVAMGVEEGRVVVEGDEVDLSPFEKKIDPTEAKKAFGLPMDTPIIGYVGSFVTHGDLEKGVGDVIQALSSTEAHGFVVGGPTKWRERYQQQAADLDISSSITFHDPVPASQVPLALAACDICVYPAPKSDHPYFTRDTSPLKLFEYLAAAKPIVAADLPTVRDLLSEDTAMFYQPGNTDALTNVISKLITDPEFAAKLASNGFNLVQNHSWNNRMNRILQGIGQN